MTLPGAQPARGYEPEDEPDLATLRERAIQHERIRECWLCGGEFCEGVRFECDADDIEFCKGCVREAAEKAGLLNEEKP